jgi:hypothetical protein
LSFILCIWLDLKFWYCSGTENLLHSCWPRSHGPDDVFERSFLPIRKWRWARISPTRSLITSQLLGRNYSIHLQLCHWPYINTLCPHPPSAERPLCQHRMDEGWQYGSKMLIYITTSSWSHVLLPSTRQMCAWQQWQACTMLTSLEQKQFTRYFHNFWFYLAPCMRQRSCAESMWHWQSKIPSAEALKGRTSCHVCHQLVVSIWTLQVQALAGHLPSTNNAMHGLRHSPNHWCCWRANGIQEQDFKLIKAVPSIWMPPPEDGTHYKYTDQYLNWYIDAGYQRFLASHPHTWNQHVSSSKAQVINSSTLVATFREIQMSHYAVDFLLS